MYLPSSDQVVFIFSLSSVLTFLTLFILGPCVHTHTNKSTNLLFIPLLMWWCYKEFFQVSQYGSDTQASLDWCHYVLTWLCLRILSVSLPTYSFLCLGETVFASIKKDGVNICFPSVYCLLLPLLRVFSFYKYCAKYCINLLASKFRLFAPPMYTKSLLFFFLLYALLKTNTEQICSFFKKCFFLVMKPALEFVQHLWHSNSRDLVLFF